MITMRAWHKQVFAFNLRNEALPCQEIKRSVNRRWRDPTTCLPLHLPQHLIGPDWATLF